MFTRHRTLGFVIKKRNFSESDQILTIYTKEFGKLRILGKALRKIKSKLRSGIPLFCLSEVEFIQGKRQKILTDAFPRNRFEHIREDLRKLKVAYEIADKLDNLVAGEQKDQDLWELLREVFNKLNISRSEVPVSKLKIIYYYFLWNLLSILGYRPELHQCLVCRKKLAPKDLRFSSTQGGVVHGDCLSKSGQAQKISPEIVKVLRLFLSKDWEILSRLKINSQQQDSLRSISKVYLSEISEHRL